MKQLIFFSFFVLSLTFISCNQKTKQNKTITTSVTNKIEVIDFYGTHRCVTCKAIESNAKYTIDTYFTDEQKKGIVIFKTINVSDDKNYSIVETYEATGTALFLNVIKNGKEKHIDLTNFGFSKGRDQEIFSKELKTIIESELKNL